MATIDEISEAFYDYSVNHYEEELKNSEKPSEKSFPTKSVFQEDFQTSINAVYNELNSLYPQEQANYVYKTLLANLNKQSQNPGQSKIVNSSKGKINRQNLKAYSKKVQETLKSRHPERFELKEAFVESKTLANDSKNTVDFNNPAEKKAYFDNLYKGLLECKTKEEETEYIQNAFGISLENMSDKQQDEVINNLKRRAIVIGIRDTFDEDAIRKENPDLDDEEIKQLIEDEAAKQYALEHNEDPEKAVKDNRLMIEFEEKKAELEKLNQDLLNCTDETKKTTINNNIATLEEGINELAETLSLTNEELEQISEKSEEEIDKSSEDLEISGDLDIEDILYGFQQETEEPSETTDINEMEEFSEDTDLSSLFDAPINNHEQINSIPKSIPGVNQIVTGSSENDFETELDQTGEELVSKETKTGLKQEDYTINIEEEGFWNKIKSGFSKITKFISEKLNLNENKKLKGQELLDTAENNTKTVKKYTEVENIFDDSLKVSEEELKRNKQENEATKRKAAQKQNNVLEVTENTGQSISL